jgi:hypothetical protein
MYGLEGLKRSIRSGKRYGLTAPGLTDLWEGLVVNDGFVGVFHLDVCLRWMSMRGVGVVVEIAGVMLVEEVIRGSEDVIVLTRREAHDLRLGEGGIRTRDCRNRK